MLAVRLPDDHDPRFRYRGRFHESCSPSSFIPVNDAKAFTSHANMQALYQSDIENIYETLESGCGERLLALLVPAIMYSYHNYREVCVKT